MSNQSKIMGEVTNTIRFAIEFSRNRLIEHINDGEYELTKEQVRELCSVLETSINVAYQRSMDQIVSTLD